MSIYIEFFKKSFLQNYYYKINSYIEIMSSILKISIQISVWTALYSEKENINGITLDEVISFLIINLVMTYIAYTDIGSKIAVYVREGTIGVHFLRPVNFKLFLISEDMGESCFKVIFNVLPVCIFISIIRGLLIPHSYLFLILFLLSALLAVQLMYQLKYVLGLLSFWFRTSFYMNWFSRALFELFAGTFLPLWFYPDFLYNLSRFLPFRYILFDPISIYLGKVKIDGAIYILIIQFIWIVILHLIDTYMWKKIKSIVTVDGG